MSDQYVPIEVKSTAPIIPIDIRGVMELAEILADSGMIPESFNRAKKPAAAIFAAIEMGKGLGLTPLQSVQSIYVINGCPRLWGDAKLGIVMQSGKLQKIKEWFEGQGDQLKAICEVIRDGIPEPVRREFSWKDATHAGLTGKPGPWKNYPKRMMQHRARNLALNDVFPDVLCGLIRDDFDDPLLNDSELRNVTPQTPAPTSLSESLKSETKVEKAPDPEPPQPETDVDDMFEAEVVDDSEEPKTRDEECRDWLNHVKSTVASKRKRSTLMEYLESSEVQDGISRYTSEFGDMVNEFKDFSKHKAAELRKSESEPAPEPEPVPVPESENSPQVVEIIHHINTKKSLESLKEYQTGIKSILGEMVFNDTNGATTIRKAIEAKTKELSA